MKKIYLAALLAVFVPMLASAATRTVVPSPNAQIKSLAPVNLLSAGNFVILSETGVTNSGSHSSAITGNIGSSPITAAAMNDVFCSEITGTIYGVDAAYVGSGSQTCFAGNPPLANKTLVDNAVLDMGTAYADAAGRTNPTATELGAGNIGGLTIAPGLYKWSTGVIIPTNVTLSGGPNDVWIFQIAGNLSIASGPSVSGGTKVILKGGAKASHVFWQVGGSTGATLGTYSTFNGNILSAKQVILQTGAVLNGRALAQTQVTLDANVVTVLPPSPVTDSGFAWGFYPNPYVITFSCTSGCSGNYVHDMTVNSFNANTGAFTASGIYEPDHSTTWNANGTTTANADATGAITFHILYTGTNSGYTIDAVGSIANDGSLSGTASSAGQTFTWTMNRKAKPIATFKNATSCNGFDGWNGVLASSSIASTAAADIRIDGSQWASDKFHWSLKVREISSNTPAPGQSLYCGMVNYTGVYTTPTGTEAGPYLPSAGTITGKISGDFVGSEIVSFTANSAVVPGLSGTGDWYGWMNDYFTNVNIVSENQVWAYAHNNAAQQWVETYSVPGGWANYGNITNP